MTHSYQRVLSESTAPLADGRSSLSDVLSIETNILWRGNSMLTDMDGNKEERLPLLTRSDKAVAQENTKM